MKKYVLGVNVGSQSIRVFLYDEDMKCVYSATEEQDEIAVPRPAWSTQRASRWWSGVCAGIKKITKKFDTASIVAVGCCAHMHGAVPIGGGAVLDDDIQMYSDKRGAGIVEGLKARRDAAELSALAANPPAASWWGVKLKWIKDNKAEIYEKADKFLTPKDFINYRLSGECCIDPSEASGAFLMDAAYGEWSGALIDALGLDRAKLPRIAASHEVIGCVTSKAARETGLREGTKVVCGGGDMLCTLFVSGLSEAGNLVDSTATASAICYYAEEPMPDPNVMNLRNVIGGWVTFGHIDASGSAYRWLRDTLAKRETREAELRGVDAYHALNALAGEAPPGADGLVFLPFMMGERTMGSVYSRGCYIGVTPGTKTGHLVRALLEGVAFQHKRYIDVFLKNGAKINNAYAISGGAKGALWNQIKADVYRRTIYTLDIEDGESFGAALLAAVGAGIFGDAASTARSLLRVNAAFEPNPANAARYEELYAVFCELHDVLQRPFFDLAKATGQVK